MKTIKLKTTMAGPGGCFQPGQVATFDDREADDLVKGGFAVEIEGRSVGGSQAAAAPEPAKPVPEPPASPAEVKDDLPEGVKKLPGGWYQLPDGRKVHGAAALADALGDNGNDDA